MNRTAKLRARALGLIVEIQTEHPTATFEKLAAMLADKTLPTDAQVHYLGDLLGLESDATPDECRAAMWRAVCYLAGWPLEGEA